MPLIPAQAAARERVSLSLRLDRQLYDELQAYATFLNSSREHIIGHALGRVFRHDKAFREWLETRSDPAAALEP